MIINSRRSSSSNRSQNKFVCTKNGFWIDGLFFIGKGMFKIGSGWSFRRINGHFSLFLLVAGSLFSFELESGDGNKCIDGLGGPYILSVEVSIILMLAFGDAIVKELEAGESCLGLESLWV